MLGFNNDPAERLQKLDTLENHEVQAILTLLCRCSTVDMLGPRNLRVSDEWYTRFRVSWDPAPAKVNGYKLLYKPKGTRVLI